MKSQVMGRKKNQTPTRVLSSEPSSHPDPPDGSMDDNGSVESGYVSVGNGHVFTEGSLVALRIKVDELCVDTRALTEGKVFAPLEPSASVWADLCGFVEAVVSGVCMEFVQAGGDHKKAFAMIRGGRAVPPELEDLYATISETIHVCLRRLDRILERVVQYGGQQVKIWRTAADSVLVGARVASGVSSVAIFEGLRRSHDVHRRVYANTPSDAVMLGVQRFDEQRGQQGRGSGMILDKKAHMIELITSIRVSVMEAKFDAVSSDFVREHLVQLVERRLPEKIRSGPWHIRKLTVSTGRVEMFDHIDDLINFLEVVYEDARRNAYFDRERAPYRGYSDDVYAGGGGQQQRLQQGYRGQQTGQQQQQQRRQQGRSSAYVNVADGGEVDGVWPGVAQVHSGKCYGVQRVNQVCAVSEEQEKRLVSNLLGCLKRADMPKEKGVGLTSPLGLGCYGFLHNGAKEALMRRGSDLLVLMFEQRVLDVLDVDQQELVHLGQVINEARSVDQSASNMAAVSMPVFQVPWSTYIAAGGRFDEIMPQQMNVVHECHYQEGGRGSSDDEYRYQEDRVVDESDDDEYEYCYQKGRAEDESSGDEGQSASH